MNVDNNRRFQETEERIMRAYGSLVARSAVSKITISQVCQEAGIHRTTFYGHFDGIYEIQERLEQQQIQQWTRGFLGDDGVWDIRQGFLHLLQFYYQYQNIVRLHMTSEDFDRWKRLFTFHLMTDTEKQSYMRFFHLKNERESSYHRDFFVSGFFSVIQSWVLSGCREKPEEIADILCTILLHG